MAAYSISPNATQIGLNCFFVVALWLSIGCTVYALWAQMNDKTTRSNSRTDDIRHKHNNLRVKQSERQTSRTQQTNDSQSNCILFDFSPRSWNGWHGNAQKMQTINPFAVGRLFCSHSSGRCPKRYTAWHAVCGLQYKHNILGVSCIPLFLFGTIGTCQCLLAQMRHMTMNEHWCLILNVHVACTCVWVCVVFFCCCFLSILRRLSNFHYEFSVLMVNRTKTQQTNARSHIQSIVALFFVRHKQKFQFGAICCALSNEQNES